MSKTIEGTAPQISPTGSNSDDANNANVIKQEAQQVNYNVEIIKYPAGDISSEEVQNSMKAAVKKYSESVSRQDGIAVISFNEYLKQQYYPDKDVILVADLSGITFEGIDLEEQKAKAQNLPYKEKDATDLMLDMRGLDFSGCMLKNARFYNCDLTGAVFCDTNLDQVEFNVSKLANVDFRGADLSACNFNGNYKISPYNSNEYIGGIKHSTSSDLIRFYADINGELLKKNNLQAQIDINKLQFQKLKEETAIKIQELNDKIAADNATISKLKGTNTITGAVINALNIFTAAKDPSDENSRMISQIERRVKGLQNEVAELNNKLNVMSDEIETGKLPPKEYIFSSSIQNIGSGRSGSDPTYMRGSSARERNIPKTQISLTAEEIRSYLKQVRENRETDPQYSLSLNDFAKAKFIEQEKAKGNVIDDNIKIVASVTIKDMSFTKAQSVQYWSDLPENKKVNLVDYRFVRPDLSGPDFDFSDMDLRGVNFSGANLSGCNFTGADIRGASFESALVDGARFHKTNAENANFFNTDLSNINISECDFRHCFMSRSKAIDATVSQTNFDASTIKKGQWDSAKIADCTFNDANLEGLSLINADIRRIEAQHAILSNAILQGANIEYSNFSKAIMDRVDATKSKWKASNLESIEAKNIDLTEAELEEFCSLSDADLDSAIMTKIRAHEVNFKNARMIEIQAIGAEFNGAILDNAKMQFANLQNANLDGAKAAGVNLTGAQMQSIQAIKADFTRAIMQDIEASGAILNESILRDADLSGAILKKAIMEKVNLERANLKGANLSDVKASGNGEGAQVDTNTIITDETDLAGLEGSVLYNGESMSAIQAQAKGQEVNKARNASFFAKAAGGILTFLGSSAKKVAEYVEHPIGEKTGAIIGLAAGVAFGVAALAAIPTGGLSLVAFCAVSAAVVGGCAIVGGVGGYFGSRKIGATDIASAVTGFFTAGPFGAVAAFGAAIAANKTLKKIFGMDTNEILATGGNKVGNALTGIGESLGGTEEAQTLLAQAELNPHNPVEKTEELAAVRLEEPITNLSLVKCARIQQEKRSERPQLQSQTISPLEAQIRQTTLSSSKPEKQTLQTQLSSEQESKLPSNIGANIDKLKEKIDKKLASQQEPRQKPSFVGQLNNERDKRSSLTRTKKSPKNNESMSHIERLELKRTKSPNEGNGVSRQ